MEVATQQLEALHIITPKSSEICKSSNANYTGLQTGRYTKYGYTPIRVHLRKIDDMARRELGE